MNRQYNIRKLFIGGLLMVITFNVMAQDLISGDTIKITKQNIMLGRLFSTDKYSNTSASVTISGDKLNKTVNPNLMNTMAGQLPGLSIRQSNGIPGSDNAGWLIRGIGSYGFGRESESKLFVDGFEVNAEYLAYLTSAEIESVTVLKDAASLAVFGMRGSNGVIWIETKRGKVAKPTVTIQLRGSLQQAVNINKPLNSYDYGVLYNQAISNDNGAWTPGYTDGELNDYKNGTLPNVDWYDEVLKKNASYLDANISFNGGNRIARYNIVLDYFNQQGLLNTGDSKDVSNAKMDRFNLRTNFDFNMFDIFEAKIDLGGRIENSKQPNYDINALMNDLASYPSNIYNPYDNEEDEHFSGTTLYPNNPLGSIKGLGWRSSRLRILQGNFALKEKLDFLTEGLYMQQAFSFYSRTISTYNKTKNYARYMNGETTTTDETTSMVAGGYGSGGMNDWKQAVITLGYSHEFDKHAINSAVNFHLSDYKGDGRFGYKYHYLNYNGRINYVYDNKYAAEFGASYFGSDSYAPGNRWGFYPAVSLGWTISNEDFLKSNNVVNFLKFRASAGKTGGADSGESLSTFASNGRFLYQQYYYYTGGFNTGNNTPYKWNSGLVPMFMANKDAFAEKSMKYNVGFDLNIFKKLDFTVDMFLDKRSDILTINQTNMSYYGKNYYQSNIGKMTNKGFEANVSYTDKLDKVDYTIFGIASYAKNKIDYYGEVPTAYSYNARTGRSYGSIMGLVSDGFYQLNDFNADGSLKDGVAISSYGNTQPGDLKYKDLNNDGYIDDTDITKIGDPDYPQLTYSFGGQVRFNGFDFNIMFRGGYKSSVNLMDYKNQFVAFMDNNNAYKVAKGAWAYFPEQGIDTRANATYPRLTTVNNTNNYVNSSFWVKNNDFLRIQYVELGYNFSHKLIKTNGIKNLRLFFNATNPMTWSKVLKEYDMDPESYYGYPALKTFTVGFSLTL
ncbi:SusC/RagA family TonB-linked outer membrane protein [Dysgonomonas sp. Marseille-P4677]|uniref:SusC/RagA family TonB-linked outer membrane protein n=1 Tax=Dysgonomonas sp. Marseille-P4677 TaxID=2364790 RepID=UPI001911A536|nr:SusC/RagA family TonB-linked outer membrane protein [Dysgonomonas sp. Marseille-P4677]MBK5722927.1 SusC/RagA family TonB-linked outer membrane protein [Dysgonomonas sp. Marseille-P4677]